MRLDKFAAVRVEAGGLTVSLAPEGTADAGGFPLEVAPGIAGRPTKGGDRWVGLELVGAGRHLVLEEQSSYIARVESPGRPAPLAFGVDTLASTPLAVVGDAAVFRLVTGNLVGLTRLVAETRAAAPSWPGLPIRIRVRKLGDPDRDFEWMVDDIVSAVRSLALTIAAPTSLGIVRSSRGRGFAYEDLIFLRSISRDVERVMDRITRRPHFRMASRTSAADASRAAEVDPGGLMQLAADPLALALAPSAAHQARVLSSASAHAMTTGGRRWVPVRVPAVRRVVDYDTFENRFVRFALEAFRDRSHAIAVAARAAGRPGLAGEADALAVGFGSWLRRSPVDTVGMLRGFAMTSQVLLREDSYNAMLRRYREFLLTSDVAWDGFDLLQESRDAAKLYEMWVFIQTVRAIATFADPIPRADAASLLRLDRSGLVVNLRRGVRSSVAFSMGTARVDVSYDRTYGRSNADPRPSGKPSSYSLALRPDVTIELRSGGAPIRGFIDAKYRVERLPSAFDDPELVAEEDATVEPGSFKVDDLNKMHAYRDAIGGARFAVAAYPGHITRLYPSDSSEFATGGGVGALALRPGAGESPADFRGVVKRLVEGQLRAS